MPESDDPVIRRAEKLLGVKKPGTRIPAAEYAALLERYRRLSARFNKVMVISDGYGAELKKVTEQLEHLRELALPICMFCKKIRVDEDYWEQIDGYFARHIDVAFSHGICPTCMNERYGGLMGTDEKKEKIASDVRARARTDTGKIPDTDEAVRAAVKILESPTAGLTSVRTGLSRLTDRYRRLLRRMGKILLISDGYQARLMELNASLNLLAHTDALTGLSNRHDAVEKLETEKSRTGRHGGTFTVAIADIDDFKTVNDTRGHESGDILLREIGRLLRASVRREDTCARWGGEEFLLVLPETDGPAAEALLSKLLSAARNLSVPHRGKPLRCTLSAGYATFHDGATVDDLLRDADAALYEAKRRGKDRVVAAPVSP